MINFDHKVTLKKGQKCVLAFIGDAHHNLEASHRKLFADCVGDLADRAKIDIVCLGWQGDYCDPFSQGEKLKVRGAAQDTLPQVPPD